MTQNRDENPTAFSSRLWILAALCFLGIAVSAMLSSHYYGIRSGTLAFKSYCNLGQTMNCDVVAASPYSELFAGFPLSSFSAGWYLAMFIIAFFAQNVYWRRETVRALFGMSLVGVGFSVVYFLIMASVLKTYCLLCLILDGVNIVSLILALTFKPEGFSQHKLDWAKWKTFFGVIGVSLLVSIAGMKSLDAENLREVNAKEEADSILASPVVPVKVDASSPGFGPLDAKVTIVEFSDFQCPFCRIGAMSLNSAFNRYPGKIRVVFKNFPLDNSCNRKMDHPLHTVACEAARVALCAKSQGRFKEAYEAMFEQQASLAPGKAADLVREAGIDRAQLDACVGSQDTGLKLATDIEEAIQLDVGSTPTFFINGHRAAAVQPAAVWSELIERLLKQ